MLKDYFFHNKNQSSIVHLMHLKVVNSTNINDPLTIFESQQFQNRQTDSRKQQQSVRMQLPTLADVYNEVKNGYLTWLDCLYSTCSRDNQKQYAACDVPQHPVYDDMNQICYILKNVQLKYIML